MTDPRLEPGRRAPELVEIAPLDSSIKLDVRYATPDNFVGKKLYLEPRAFLQRPAALALVRAHQALAASGYGLVVFDAYRPWSVTKLMWDVTPEDKKPFVADPKKGSRHNRGCAVDATLYERATGRAVEMPSSYDEMTERSHIEFAGGSDAAREHRRVLREALEGVGFKVYAPEWWHYDFQDWKEYGVLDIAFSEIR